MEIRVRLADKTDRVVLEPVFPTTRGTGDDAIVEFDVPLLALRLQTANHGYQYLSILTLWPQSNQWPRSIHFNVGQQQMTMLDGKATNTLFCPTWNVTAAG